MNLHPLLKRMQGQKTKVKEKNYSYFKLFLLEFVWVGDKHCLTTGLSKSFERQFYLFDIRNTEKPI